MPSIKVIQECILEIDKDSIPELTNTCEYQEKEVAKESDGRKQIHQTGNWPYSVHGVVLANFAGKTYRGSGTLIGLNMVMTAAHNIYKYDTSCEANEIDLIPGINGTFAPFGICKAVIFFCSDNYKRNKTDDYVILLLDKAIGERQDTSELPYLSQNKL